MQNNVAIKRATTPILPITIETPCENIKHIDFIFKTKIEEKAPKLLEKSFDFPEAIDEAETTLTIVSTVEDEADATVEIKDEFFVVNVPFKEKDTRKLTDGTVYMDTRIVYNNNLIPPTEIVQLNIAETLFNEVFNK